MPTQDRAADGYRHNVGPGPRIRTDIIDVYVFTRTAPHASPPKPTFAAKGRAPGASRGSAGGIGAESFGSEPSETYFLQLLRTKPPMLGSWHPVMGHIEAAPQTSSQPPAASETARATAGRELREELALDVQSADVLGAWALEQVHPFYLPALDCIVMSPRFAVEVRAGWTPTLNHEHSAFRWVNHRDVHSAFMWPGQLAAIRELLDTLIPRDSLSREILRVEL